MSCARVLVKHQLATIQHRPKPCLSFFLSWKCTFFFKEQSLHLVIALCQVLNWASIECNPFLPLNLLKELLWGYRRQCCVCDGVLQCSVCIAICTLGFCYRLSVLCGWVLAKIMCWDIQGSNGVAIERVMGKGCYSSGGWPGSSRRRRVRYQQTIPISGSFSSPRTWGVHGSDPGNLKLLLLNARSFNNKCCLIWDLILD